MRSKSFDIKEVREIGRKETGESRGFPILCMGIIEDAFQMEGMQRPGKIKDVKKKKIHARARKVLSHGIGDFVWDSGSG